MLEINNTTKQSINSKKIKEIVERFLRVYKKSGWTVSLAIVGDAAIKKMNQQYRGINKVTDVLSFPGLESKSISKSARYLGELIINIQETKKIWKYREFFKDIGGASYNQKYIFYFVLVHGLLHLVGYNDETLAARQEMLKLGEKFLRNQIDV